MGLTIKDIPLALFDLFNFIFSQHQLLTGILQLGLTFGFVQSEVNFTLSSFLLTLFELSFSLGDLLIRIGFGLDQSLALLLDLRMGRSNLFINRFEYRSRYFKSLIDQIQLRLRRGNFGF